VKLVTYRADGRLRAGVLVGDVVVDAAHAPVGASGARDGDTPTGTSCREIVAMEPDERRAIADAAAQLAGAGEAVAGRLPDLELGPPVADPEKILCLGLNYREHATEMALDAPSAPTLFPKFRNALTGSGTPIVIPRDARQVDYEGELAVVIGRRCRNVPEDRAMDHVAGYMPLNDVSARDLQMATSQWTAGKIPDTFAPCGPVLVLSDEIPDPHALSIETRVNGATRQSASTAQMIFGVAETVGFISRLVTLEAGDIIATGTPAGVGYRREPPVFLEPGDVVEVEIEGLGTLVNPVVGADGGPRPPALAVRERAQHGELVPQGGSS
jgi:2-keto-4-pentenoate hydratase/2-oxohepta-3-ene-1,7-dioic acid hydratase in catechol pathway